MRPLTTLVLISSLWLGGAVTAQSSATTATAYQTANVRSGPGVQFEVIARLNGGDRVTVTGRDSEQARWLLVVLENGQSGWVMAFSVTLQGSVNALQIVRNDDDEAGISSGEVVVAAYGRVNVRSGPGILYSVTGQLNSGDTALALARDSEKNDWLYVEADDLQGWVAYFAVMVTGNPNGLPVRVPDGDGDGLVPPSTLVFTRYNVYLRTGPTLDASVSHLAPFDTPMTPVGRTEDSLWIYVVYEGGEGWGIAELFTISADQLQQLPFDMSAFTPQPSTSLPDQTPEAGDSGS